MVGRKGKHHHNVSRCVKHMLHCAGTEMCKCNTQFLSLLGFRKYFMYVETNDSEIHGLGSSPTS